jgi:hypothetical protein
MRRISSRMTFYNKRIFPAIWFGGLLVFVGIGLFADAAHNRTPPLPFFIMPVIMMVVGYFLVKRLAFDLVDEVWDDGDSLLIKNRSEQERIALRDIKNISYSPMMNPPRVTLSLRRPTVFGDEITFGAPVRLVPFAKSPIVNDLIDRIDLARQKNR